MELIEQIREKCIEVNPEIVGTNDGVRFEARTIRLADILLVMHENRKEGDLDVAVDRAGEFLMENGLGILGITGIFWRLEHDDLTEQSPQTVALIANVLGITS